MELGPARSNRLCTGAGPSVGAATMHPWFACATNGQQRERRRSSGAAGPPIGARPPPLEWPDRACVQGVICTRGRRGNNNSTDLHDFGSITCPCWFRRWVGKSLVCRHGVEGLLYLRRGTNRDGTVRVAWSLRRRPLGSERYPVQMRAHRAWTIRARQPWRDRQQRLTPNLGYARLLKCLWKRRCGEQRQRLRPAATHPPPLRGVCMALK